MVGHLKCSLSHRQQSDYKILPLSEPPPPPLPTGLVSGNSYSFHVQTIFHFTTSCARPNYTVVCSLLVVRSQLVRAGACAGSVLLFFFFFFFFGLLVAGSIVSFDVTVSNRVNSLSRKKKIEAKAFDKKYGNSSLATWNKSLYVTIVMQNKRMYRSIVNFVL